MRNLKTRTLQSSRVIQKIQRSKDTNCRNTHQIRSRFHLHHTNYHRLFYQRQIKTDSGVLEMWPLLEFVILEANRRRGHSGPRKLLGGPLGKELACHRLLATKGSMVGRKVSHLAPLRPSANTPAKWIGEANHLPTQSFQVALIARRRAAGNLTWTPGCRC